MMSITIRTEHMSKKEIDAQVNMKQSLGVSLMEADHFFSYLKNRTSYLNDQVN